MKIMRDLSALIAAALLTLAACDGREPAYTGGDTAAAPTDTSPGNGAGPLPLTAECVNAQDGYTVRYPGDWQVNTGEIMARCSLFDPDPMEVPVASEVPIEFAIQIDVEPVRFASIAGDVLGRRALARESTTVGGREAVRIDAETTGEGLHDRGIRHRLYLVNLGERTLTATTYDVGDGAFRRNQAVLDRMMESLSFLR